MTGSPSLQSAFRSTLRARRDQPVLAFFDRREQFRWMNGAEVESRGAAMALQMQELGLGPGDVCTIVLPSGSGSAFALLGVLMTGSIPLLIAPPSLQKYNADLVETIGKTVRRSRTRLLIHDHSLDDQISLPGSIRRLAIDSGHLPEPCGAVFDWPDPSIEETAAYQLTSGTTGFPRICVWSHRAVLAALQGMSEAMHLRDDDVFFNWTPLYHDMGLVNNFFTCLWRGLPMVLQNPNDFVRRPGSWLRGLAATGSTVAWSPNFGFALAAERVTDEEMGDTSLAGVRQFWNAAERIHLHTFEKFHRRFSKFGVRWETLKTNFGCAENIGGATFSDPDGPLVAEHVDAEAFQRKGIAIPSPEQPPADDVLTFVSAGRPHPGIRMRIVSSRGRELPEGHVGELSLHTPSRLDRFQGDAASTRRAHFGDELRTGDLGYRRGNEFFWVGRARERINTKGKKFDPSDFEAPLLGIPGLRKGCFAAFGVDDPAQGTQRVVLLCERDDRKARPEDELIADVRERVFRMLDLSISEIVILPPGVLSKTSSGKRRHRNFRRLYLAGDLATLTSPDSK